MRKVLIFLAFTLFYYHSSRAQNITGYEYWIDDYANVNTQSITSVPQYTFDESIDLSVLDEGLHMFNIRFEDENGSWSSLISKFFYKTPSNVSGVINIVSYEYWLDSDYANKVNTDVTNNQQVNVNQMLDYSTLKEGLHLINIRFKDSQGNWSSSMSKFFYKEVISATGSSDIVNYEYWLDNDYAAKVVKDVAASPLLTINEMLDYSALKEGLHLFNIRFKDSQDKWSSLSSKFFYKSPLAASGAVQLEEYEYWFDDDYGNMVNQSITSTEELSLNESFDFSNLKEGLHSFNIRVKDNLEKWSSPLTKFIYKKPVDGNIAKEVVNYQYWLDEDFANATIISVANSSDVELIENLNFSDLLAGTHQLNIRFQDNDGKWSGVLTEEFLKVGTKLDDYLVAYYPFTGNANDESGNENHGVNNGATLITDRKGNLEQAYSFDGINDFIEVDNGISMPSNSVSLSAWIKADRYAPYNTIAGNIWDNGSSESGYGLSLMSGNIVTFACATTATYSLWSGPSATINDAEWSHIVGVFDGTNAHIYLNGVLVESKETTGIINYNFPNNFRIGIYKDSDEAYYYSGAIDEVRVYNKALSSDEVAEVYNMISTDTEVIPLTNVSIYPNPVKDILRVNLPDTNCRLTLYNLSGQLVYGQDVISSDCEVNMGNLQSGVYILRLKGNGINQTIKVVKK